MRMIMPCGWRWRRETPPHPHPKHSPYTPPAFDDERTNLLNMSVEVPNDLCVRIVNELHNRWVLYTRKYVQHQVECARALMNPDGGACDPEQVRATDSQTRTICVALHERMAKLRLIDPENESDLLGRKLTAVIHVVGRVASAVLASHHLAGASALDFSAASPAALNMFRLRMGVEVAGGADEVANLTGCQRVILTVLERAFNKNLRKYKGYMFEQVLVGEGAGVYHTHAWQALCSIKEFVYKCSDKHTDWEMWKALTAGGKNADMVVDYIVNSTSDMELPALKPNRHVFSFKNGVYDALGDEMYVYGSGSGVPETFVASKFFDVAMPVGFEDTPDHPCDFRDIPTPVLDGILTYQGLSNEPWVPPKYRNRDRPYPGYSVIDWVYVFMGRMIYEIGEYDTWQSLMFLKGKAGTGKSTLGKIMSHLYDRVDVGVLSNNIERKFGLSGLVDKLIYICYEVKKDFQLDQGEMQSMISGEPIAIATKNKDPRSETWKTHGFFMGNEFPAWTNNSGSIGRRIVTVLFNTVVTDGDPRMYDKLQEEMGHIIVKINRAYRECAATYGGSDIATVMPPYFEETRERELEANTSPLSAFLVHIKYDDEGSTMVFDPAGTVPYTHFKECFMVWVQDNLGSKARVSLTPDDLFPLHRHGLRKDGGVVRGLRVGSTQ